MVTHLDGEHISLACLELDTRGDQPVVHLVLGVIGSTDCLVGFHICPGLAVVVGVNNSVSVHCAGVVEGLGVRSGDFAQRHLVGLGC